MKIVAYTCNDGIDLIKRNEGVYVWTEEDRLSERRRNTIIVDTDYIENYVEGRIEYRIPVGNSNRACTIVNSNKTNKNELKEKFLVENLEKSGSTLKGIASIMTQSFEVEAMTGVGTSGLTSNLNAIGKGLASDKQVNDGNGWNNDIHHDLSLASYVGEHGGLYGTETSSSPISFTGYTGLKKELEEMLSIYRKASNNKVMHTVLGSTHVHNTVAYYEDINSIKLDYKEVYDNIGRFILKFMPVMKWLTMTDKLGARGVRGSSYGDQFGRDNLFSWWSNYSGETNSDDSFHELTSMGRQSCFRVYSRNSLHYENRLCDCTFNATHLAMWLSVNKAITLFAIDFSRNGFKFPLRDEEVDHSRRLMQAFKDGYEKVDRNDIESMYKVFVSYLAKYLKITNSLDAIDVMDKLIKCPISQWLKENDIELNYWDMVLIEKVFNTRNRATDENLRDKFIHAIKSMQVPFADSLSEFHENMAIHLGVEEKKVKSLYQMFKRENIDIEFIGGRLVYLGD